jgi:hypothetical protein
MKISGMQPNSNYIAGNENRVLNALQDYAAQEAQLKIAKPGGHAADPFALQLKYQHYGHIYNALKKGATPEERRSLQYVRHERAKLRARIMPNLLRRFRYAPLVDTFITVLARNYTFYQRHHKALMREQSETIKAHNAANLQDTLQKAGFNRSMEGPLQKMVALDLPEFHLHYNDPLHCKNTDFVLHFKKLHGSDIYYLERFDAIARPTLQSTLTNDHSTVRQSFYLLDGIPFSPVEAANLANGRSVWKSINGKENWLALDPSKKDQQQELLFISQAFNLEKALEKNPITRETNPKQRRMLIQRLKNGSQADITIRVSGQLETFTIEASPKNKSLYVTDGYHRPVNAEAWGKNKVTNQLDRIVRKGEDGVTNIKKPERSLLRRL